MNQLVIADPAARVLLTGSSHGIGKAILLALARNRHFVLALSRTRPEGLSNSGRDAERDYVTWKRLDLANLEAVVQCTASLAEIRIRAMILCAVDYGASGRHPASATSMQEWQRVIATNCVGHCVLVSSLLPKLLADPPGIIINLSSDVAIVPACGRAAYGASKAGLHAMLRAVAAECSAESLRVYQLIPTFQLLTQGIRRRRPADFDFSCYADPSLIAQIVLRLLSPAEKLVPPGSYLVRRDGTLDAHQEHASLHN